jgi:hypothetical protein
MPEAFVLSEDAVGDLRDLLTAYRGGRLSVRDQPPPPPPPRVTTYVARTTGTITARADNVPGSGPAVILKGFEDEDTDDWLLVSTAIPETVYNLSLDTVATNSYVMLAREPVSGLLVVLGAADTADAGAGPGVTDWILVLSDGPVVGHPDPWWYQAVRYTPGSVTKAGTRGEAILARGPNFEALVRCRKYIAKRRAQVGKAVAFEVSGVADGTGTGCGVLDGLWVLDSTGFPPDPAGYTAYLGINLGTVDGKNLCMTLSYAPAIPGWLLTVYTTPATDGGAVAGYVILASYLDGAAPADWDTAGPLTALDMALYGTPPGDCTGWPEALTINPTVSSTGAAKIYVWVTQETADGTVTSGAASEHTAADCAESLVVTLACCPDPMPGRLYATLTNIHDADCVGTQVIPIDFTTDPLLFGGTPGGWAAEGVPLGSCLTGGSQVLLYIYLWCEPSEAGAHWQLEVGADGCGVLNMSNASFPEQAFYCDPFFTDWIVQLDEACGGTGTLIDPGQFRLTITEEP